MRNKRVVLFFFWAVYTTIIIFLCLNHEPFGDEYKVWGIAKRMTVPEIWSFMRIEGHFCLWHLINKLWIVLFGMDYHAIFLSSCILMSLAAYLLLFKLNLHILGKLLILFSYPFLYQFPVISRCYALIPPIIIGIAVLYKKLPSYSWLYCLLVGLLAHTHVYMEGLVGVLWCVYVWDNVKNKYKKDRKCAKKNICYSLITIFLVGLAFLQIVGGIKDFNEGIAPNRQQDPGELISSLYWTYSTHFIDFINIHFPSIPLLRVDFVISVCLWCFFFIEFYKYIISNSKEKLKYTLIILVGIGFQFLFAINVYGMGNQRLFLPWIVVVFVLMIGYNVANSDLFLKMFIPFWIFSCIDHTGVIRWDYNHLFAGDIKILKFVRENEILNSTIYDIHYADFLEDLLFVQSIPAPFDLVNNQLSASDLGKGFKNNSTIYYFITAREVFFEESKDYLVIDCSKDLIGECWGPHLYKVQKINNYE